ncbi:MAG: hypothetical protein HFI72_03610, partial [Peptococcaceae bacterium]|nr:hypothetical protein [Peptococcaceae bacterium]
AMNERAGDVGNVFDSMDRILETNDVKDTYASSPKYGYFDKGTKNCLKTIDGMEILFSMGSAMEEDINNGVISSSDMITDVVVEGIKTKTSQVGTGVVVELVLKVAFNSAGGWAYTVTAVILNVFLGKVLDELLDKVAEEIKEYIKTDLMDDAMHFDEWQQTFHERDLEAGIRMD